MAQHFMRCSHCGEMVGATDADVAAGLVPTHAYPPRPSTTCLGSGKPTKHKPETLGATGRFPRGKLSPDDEGELNLSVGVRGDTVMVDFGKSVRSIGMDKASALQFAEYIRRKAMDLP